MNSIHISDNIADTTYVKYKSFLKYEVTLASCEDFFLGKRAPWKTVTYELWPFGL